MRIRGYAEMSGALLAASPERQGVGSTGKATTRRFSRASVDYIKPPGGNLYTLIPSGQEALTANGIPLHDQLLVYTPNNATYASWTLTAGSGVSAVDSTITWCDSSVQGTPQSVKLVAANPLATPPTLQVPNSVDMATQKVFRLRVLAYHVTAGTLQYALYSSRAAKWWGGASFNQVAATWSTLPAVSGDTTAFALHEVLFDKGTTVSPDYIYAVLRQSTAGAQANVGLCSLDALVFDNGMSGGSLANAPASGGPFPTASITSAAYRQPNIVRLHDESGILAPDAGTILISCTPDSTNGLNSNSDMALVQLGTIYPTPPYCLLTYAASSNVIKVFYDLGDGGGEKWIFLNSWPGSVAGAPFKVALSYNGASRYLATPGPLGLTYCANGYQLSQSGGTGSSPLSCELFSAAPCKDAWVGAGLSSGGVPFSGATFAGSVGYIMLLSAPSSARQLIEMTR